MVNYILNMYVNTHYLMYIIKILFNSFHYLFFSDTLANVPNATVCSCKENHNIDNK